jgi:uncharacterized protein YdbL (DUF1318 family)
MRLRLSLAVASLILLSMIDTARADALDAARQAGQVGERADGMVGVVGQASPQLAQSVAAINAQRLATYKDIAQRTGTSLDAVEAQAGQKLIAATPSGQFVMDASGQWRRK